ncbi:hypothetical protein [Chitinibacter sp. GC72]|uniref:hypothetical protein n=1 Tax=Chitinibacter sp. GC72 TaxID=1526917 RepID=UPI0012FA597F|nr:hypothetical protein [Chitinibacter sp. GC72]
MQVIEHQAHSWFLLSHDGQLLLDIQCHSPLVSYDFLMVLSADELAHYQQFGRGYLDQLAAAVNDSAPFGPQSPYQLRNVASAYSASVLDAVSRWRSLPPVACATPANE